jgi:pimeloyl-ACP methyl ester carboxylesterase
MGQRCGRPDVEATVTRVAGPAGEQLWTGSVGSGGTVALLVHQTGRSASCGWWPFANQLAAHGVRAVLLDLCGYGQSSCDSTTPWFTDYRDQVVRTVARLRADGATRVTLVGASLGGTVASVSAASAHVDAVVNLSGFGFGPMAPGPAISALTIPVLAAGSRTESSDSATLEGQVTASASPTKRFLWAESGHGWSLVQEGPQPDSALTPVGRAVIGWTTGDYAG